MLLDLNADWSVATTYLSDLGIDNKLRQTSSTAGVSYYLPDHLASTAGFTDASGKISLSSSLMIRLATAPVVCPQDMVTPAANAILIRASCITAPVTDQLGSTAGLTDPTGNIVEQIAYDSFGNSTGSTRTRYSFTGRERDPDTGQLYYRARFYDPQVGRFLSEDPLGLSVGPNPYVK